MQFNEFIQQYQPQLEQALDEHLGKPGLNNQLLEAMRYATLNGGKRLRPLLTLAVVKTFGQNPSQYLDVANAVELIHTYSLIHDDLPAMDDDDFRRNKPTVHLKYGEAVAILAGDALQSMAFAWLIDARLHAKQQLKLVQQLALAAGDQGMVGGQFSDMQATNQAEISLNDLAQLHRRKTGALLAYAVVAGGILTDQSQVVQQALGTFGFAFGLAFQIKDDLLDLQQDDTENKQSYPYLLGVNGAKHELMGQLSLAESSLQLLEAETNTEMVLLKDCLHYFDDMVEN